MSAYIYGSRTPFLSLIRTVAVPVSTAVIYKKYLEIRQLYRVVIRYSYALCLIISWQNIFQVLLG